jgi:hypothetical protein
MKCLPERALDRTYSFEYFQLAEMVQGIEQDCKVVSSKSQRDELLWELDDVFASHQEYYWGDDEGAYYKRRILELLHRLEELADQLEGLRMGK